jgi:hypothetical protein
VGNDLSKCETDFIQQACSYPFDKFLRRNFSCRAGDVGRRPYDIEVKVKEHGPQLPNLAERRVKKE